MANCGRVWDALREEGIRTTTQATTSLHKIKTLRGSKNKIKKQQPGQARRAGNNIEPTWPTMKIPFGHLGTFAPNLREGWSFNAPGTPLARRASDAPRPSGWSSPSLSELTSEPKSLKSSPSSSWSAGGQRAKIMRTFWRISRTFSRVAR